MSRAMQTIHRRSKGLVVFVGNYQKMTRIPTLVPGTFSAGELMNDISNLLQAEGTLFSCKINPEDMTLFADRTQIEQVLINLLKNAKDACALKPSSDIHVQLF